MKKLLSVILAAIMLLAAVPAVSYAATVIDEFSFCFIYPETGQPAYTDCIYDEDQCTIISAKWYDVKNGRYIDENTNFERGSYCLYVDFKANRGYSFTEDTLFDFNGQKIDAVKENPDGSFTAACTFECDKIDFASIPAKIIEVVKTVLLAFVRLIGAVLGL